MSIKNITPFIAINILLLLLLTSCGDCIQRVSGVVLDANTKRPVTQVMILKKEKTTRKTLSDSAGNFILEDISGGFTCPAMQLLLVKKGYDTARMEIPAGDSVTILLQALPEP